MVANDGLEERVERAVLLACHFISNESERLGGTATKCLVRPLLGAEDLVLWNSREATVKEESLVSDNPLLRK